MNEKDHAEHIDDLRSKISALLDEIESWKDASGLECGGDPDGVTPEAAREYWENIERVAQQRDDAGE